MVLTLTGSNSYLLRQGLKALVDTFLVEHGDLAFEKIDGENVEPDRLMEAVQSLPFLTARRMVVVSELSKNKPAAERVDAFLDATSDTTDLVLVESKPDKRTVFYKTLQKRTELRVFAELDEAALGSWLMGQARAAGGALKASDAQYLITRAGTNQLSLSHELEKLLTFDADISRASIDSLVEPHPQSSIFDLVDAAMAGRTRRALELYDEQRSLKVEPQQIIAMLAWQLHVMAAIKTAGTRSDADIAKEAKLNPFVVRKSSNLVRHLGLEQIKRFIRQLTEIDDQSKTVSIDPDEALKNYILGLAQ